MLSLRLYLLRNWQFEAVCCLANGTLALTTSHHRSIHPQLEFQLFLGQKVSAVAKVEKTIRNIHTNLSALWTWAVEEDFVQKNVAKEIDKPPASPPVIEQYTKEDVASLLKACDTSRSWKTRADVVNARPTADRDRAIILALLDTGVRASELCGMRYGDVNLTTNSIRVRGKGAGKDLKERIVDFGKNTGKAIWKNLLPRLDDKIREDDYLFVVGTEKNWRPMSRHVLGRLLKRFAERARIKDVYPHRFRHTFAITYLRNEGDIFSLQVLLGHSDLAMVKRYARIANVDCKLLIGRPVQSIIGGCKILKFTARN
jgi:integrase/recombinase XerD